MHPATGSLVRLADASSDSSTDESLDLFVEDIGGFSSDLDEDAPNMTAFIALAVLLPLGNSNLSALPKFSFEPLADLALRGKVLELELTLLSIDITDDPEGEEAAGMPVPLGCRVLADAIPDFLCIFFSAVDCALREADGGRIFDPV